MLIISATTDSSRGQALGWTNKGSRNTEIWHIGHEMQPSRPLCDASLSGQLKRTKGQANCSACIDNYSLRHVNTRDRGLLLAVDAGLPLPPPEYKGQTHFHLYEGDLIADIKGTCVLTSRGKAVVMDLKNPASWFDKTGRILHGRWGLRSGTRCGIECLRDSLIVEQIIELHEQAKKRKDPTITCVRCAIAENPDHASEDE